MTRCSAVSSSACLAGRCVQVKNAMLVHEDTISILSLSKQTMLGRRLAQLVEQASHVLRLCSGPGWIPSLRPFAACHSPSLTLFPVTLFSCTVSKAKKAKEIQKKNKKTKKNQKVCQCSADAKSHCRSRPSGGINTWSVVLGW